MIRKPEKVNILGREYAIVYVDNPSDVDTHKRESLWGQIDYWTRTIRIYDNGRSATDLWQTLMHELLHGISAEMHWDELRKDDITIDILSLALIDVFTRNGWITIDE